MNRRRCLKGLILAASAHGVARGASSDEAIARIAREAMKQGEIPGLSIAIAREGQIVHKAAYGEANRQAGEAVTPAHRFRIASVSKPITSAAVWALIEEGKLRLDDRVFGSGGLLPSYRGPAGVAKITLHHLLTHTCGGWGNKSNDPMFMKPDMDHHNLIAWTLKEQPLENEPGKAYAYSNFGYCLLGRIIETTSRQAYADFVQKHILAKCGITDMRLAGNGLARRQPGEVIYYGQKNEDPYRPTMNVARMDSHGGWLATAEDLVKFLTHVDGFPDTQDILKTESIKAMTTATTANPGYACGWSVNPRPNWWHGGSLPGTSSLAVRTASGLCWAALANSRLRDTAVPDKNTGALLDRMMWRIVRSVPEWQA